MSIIIEVHNVGKKYHIGENQPYIALRDTLTDLITTPLRSLKHLFFGRKNKVEKNIFLALKDISFSVEEGEVIGIIGRNGAGKSTLLKILSRITPPSEGEIRLGGRVSSLLEVGTGFNPELTGRENIFLNGAILGMKKKEMKEKFDQIVEFAGVETFLDTPVKRYSSGMYVRLAFAVAAHLDPDILIVDEVLAVGDMEFQDKCLGKLKEVTQEKGRTVLFVSHNIQAVENLCHRCILLEQGEIKMIGETKEVVDYYTKNLKEKCSVTNPHKRGGSGGVRVKDVWITHNDKITNHIPSNKKVSFHISAHLEKEFYYKDNIVIGMSIDTLKGQRLYTCVSSWINNKIQTQKDALEAIFTLNSLPLISGQYLINVSISYANTTLDYVEHCSSFEVRNENISFSRGRNETHGHLYCEYTFDYSTSIKV